MNDIPIQNVIDAIQESIIIIDLDGNIIACNSTFADRFYKSSSSLIRTSVFNLLPPDIAKSRKKYLEQSISTQSKVSFRDYRYGKWIDNTIAPIFNNDGDITSLVLIGFDITDQFNQKEKLQATEQKLEGFISNLPGIAYRCKNDANWTMEFMSDGSYELTGYPSQYLYDNSTISYGDLIHPDDRSMIWETIQQSIKLQQNFRFTYRIKTADNQEKWVYEQGKGIFDSEGNLLTLEGFITDITQQKQIEFKLNKALEDLENANAMLKLKSEQLEHLAVHDPLTGLYNRRELDISLVQEYAILQRQNQPFALMILDIDHFKKVNDSWGHPVGDEVLIGLAHLLKQDLRLNDKLIRYGGEEFAIILPSLKITDAHLLAERIRAHIEQSSFHIKVSKNDSVDLKITISIGLACAYKVADDPKSIIKKADDALYVAKRNGRNQTIVAD
jgi:diguanylate cyclase (GGDEF)-like protein/PAS domain S-box-containing protein